MIPVGAFVVATIERQLMGINDAIVEDNTLLQYLGKEGRIKYNQGGDGFAFRVRSSASAIGGASSDWAERAAKTTNPFEKISGDYRQYDWKLIISDFQNMRNKNAGNEAKMFNMLAEQMSEVKQDAITSIGQDVYGTSGTLGSNDLGTPFDGLEDIIDEDNTYLSIARGSNAWWQAQVDTSLAESAFLGDTDSDNVPDGLKVMNEVFSACCHGQDVSGGVASKLPTKKDKPDLVLTNLTDRNLIWRGLFPQFRYTGENADPMKELFFNGLPVMWDANVTAKRIYFINKDHIQFDVIGPQTLELIKVVDQDKPIAKVYVLGTQGQLYSKNPRYLGAVQLS